MEKWGGNCLAYSCLQPGLSRFGTATRGFIFFRRPFKICRSTDGKSWDSLYTKKTGVRLLKLLRKIYSPLVVLGDGLLNLEIAEETIDKFLRTNCTVSFCHIGEGMAKILSKKGFYSTPMGYETVIDLQTFNPTWRTHRWLMMTRKKASKELVVKEQRCSDVLEDDFYRIDKKWRRLKKQSFKNQAFLTRPILFKQQPGVRYFFAYENDSMVGFRLFDPMYKDGRVYGYAASISRYDPDTVSGCSTFLLLEGIDVFKKEGLSELSLGLSPFKLNSLDQHKQEDVVISERIKLSRLTFYLFKCFFRMNGFFYSFNGISLYNSHFKARARAVYFASKQNLPLFSIIYSYLNTINPFSLFFKKS